METKEMICCYCDNELEGEELESPYTNKEGEPICDDCHYEYFREVCPICEDSYDKPTTPEETFFVVSKEAGEEYNELSGITPGIYSVLEYPFFFGDIVTGFNGLYGDSIKLIKELDINSMLRKLCPGKMESVNADMICPDCASKYSRSENFAQIRHNYVDKKYNLNRTISERGIIQQGA